MRHLLLVLAAGSLLAAADSTDTITVDGLPDSVRNQLPQTINGGVVVDIQVDRHNGQPQYLVRYHGQSTTQVETIRLGQNGMVLDNALIATPSRDGTSGNLPTTTPQPLPSGAANGATPAVSPPQASGQGASGQSSNSGDGNTTTIPLPPGSTSGTKPTTPPGTRPPDRPIFQFNQGATPGAGQTPSETTPPVGQTAPPAQQPKPDANGQNGSQNGANGSSSGHGGK